MTARTAVRVLVEGEVQGVWFRGWTCQTAAGFGLTGWVRNRYDGSVEAVFAGPPATVERMIDACRRGPPAARVTRLTVEPAVDPGLDRFERRSTGP